MPWRRHTAEIRNWGNKGYPEGILLRQNPFRVKYAATDEKTQDLSGLLVEIPGKLGYNSEDIVNKMESYVLYLFEKGRYA